MKKQTVTFNRPQFRNYTIMAFVLGMVSGTALLYLYFLLKVAGVLS